jgi:sugar phosphate isomerase/epimerase
VASRDARFRLKDQLAAELAALREIGDTAAELGVTVAVENYFPDQNVLRGEVYDYSTWPSDLAEQVAAVDHPAVGICLDVGHAALAASFFGFDYFEECAIAAPLVRHVHLHDNLEKVCDSIDPLAYGDPIYGVGDLHLPPGRGSIPLAELFQRLNLPNDPSCCVELSPNLFQEAPETLHAARGLSELTAREEIAV